MYNSVNFDPPIEPANNAADHYTTASVRLGVRLGCVDRSGINASLDPVRVHRRHDTDRRVGPTGYADAHPAGVNRRSLVHVGVPRNRHIRRS